VPSDFVDLLALLALFEENPLTARLSRQCSTKIPLALTGALALFNDPHFPVGSATVLVSASKKTLALFFKSVLTWLPVQKCQQGQ
jgi:hypothetical protein